MQQIAGALGYGSSMAGQVGGVSQSARHQATASPASQHHAQATVLLSSVPPSAELTDRMYSDLVASLVWSRDSAERRAEQAEIRLHALHAQIAGSSAIPNRAIRPASPVVDD